MPSVAFLTSGGDAPGMNAAVRAITRYCLSVGVVPYAIFDGYTGLINDAFLTFNWESVSNILQTGGTLIRSARCPEFRSYQYRQKAALNLIRRKIDVLVVIGGDGSLTGAHILFQEWPQLVDSLLREDLISEEDATQFSHFSVIGIGASIDNDIVGTEMTIGADSALTRVTESLDCISSTAYSHSRAFVIEVMGRQCGWLALNAYIAGGADWVILPEHPFKHDWRNDLYDAIETSKFHGKRDFIVVLAEGCKVTSKGEITAETICNAIKERCNIECRMSVLGHIQRGGTPSSFDRVLSTLQGCKAVEYFVENKGSRFSKMIGIKCNEVCVLDLEDCIQKTIMMSEWFEAKQFEQLIGNRGANFELKMKMVHETRLPPSYRSPDSDKNILIMTVGAPCCGMNAAIHYAALSCKVSNMRPLVCWNGFEGLASAEITPVDTNDMQGIVTKGGSYIGTNRWIPDSHDDMVKIKESLKFKAIDGIVIIGGFEAYLGILRLRQEGNAFSNVPVAYLPATVSNNIPLTEYSIGSDTAVNVIVSACDAIKQSANSSRKRVFVVEVQGGNSGFLAVASGIAAGASQIYIPEEPLSLAEMQKDTCKLREGFKKKSRQGRLIIRNENANKTYSTEMMARIYESESSGEFDARWIVLGHLQQGGRPSSVDRIRGAYLSYVAVKRLASILSDKGGMESSFCLGISRSELVFNSIDSLEADSDFSRRVGKTNFWQGLKRYIPFLSW